MALTLSNRETFLALQWLESDAERREHFRQLSAQLYRRYQEAAIPRLSEAIYVGLRADMPQLEGLAAQLLGSGMAKINFYELSLALILEQDGQRNPPSIVPDAMGTLTNEVMQGATRPGGPL